VWFGEAFRSRLRLSSLGLACFSRCVSICGIGRSFLRFESPAIPSSYFVSDHPAPWPSGRPTTGTTSDHFVSPTRTNSGPSRRRRSARERTVCQQYQNLAPTGPSATAIVHTTFIPASGGSLNTCHSPPAPGVNQLGVRSPHPLPPPIPGRPNPPTPSDSPSRQHGSP
jgi:hypothetical protein